MKRLIKAVLCAVAAVAVIFAVHSFRDSAELEPAVQETFAAADYTDYYYLALNETEKQVYTAVRQQIYLFPSSIIVPKIDSDSLEKVLEALICDDPYMFMFESCSLMSKGATCFFEPDYTLTLQEYEQLAAQTAAAANEIIAAMPQGSAYETQLYLHDTLINACTYSDTGASNENSAAGVLADGRAKCSGYAKAYKLLLDKVGIPCVLISGRAEDYDGNSTGHMWAATQTDGVWSYTDITWDDPITDTGEEICGRVYFCMSEDMLRRTHSEFEFSYPCPDSGLYYYKAAEAYYNDYNNDTLLYIADLIATAAQNGTAQAEFMFADSSLLEKAENALFTEEEIYTALEAANEKTQKQIATDKIRYRIDYNTNLITLFFEIKD